MSTLTGMVAGALGLTLLQVAVSKAETDPGRVSAVLTVPAGILARWINPYTPLIPDLTTKTTGGTP